MAYFIRKNWRLIAQSHKMSWHFGESWLERLAVPKSSVILRSREVKSGGLSKSQRVDEGLAERKKRGCGNRGAREQNIS